MRVPLYVVLPLLLAVVSLAWWQGTRSYDFVSPPPEERLVEVRKQAEHAFSSSGPSDRAREAPPAADGQEEKNAGETPAEPAFDPGDIVTVPALDAYSGEVSGGVAHLLKLAAALEEKQAYVRAVLALERVLDSGKASAEEYAAALASVKRLRPTLQDWNIDPDAAVPIVVHAGTSPLSADALKPVLEEAAKDLEKASDGILAVTVEITMGKKMTGTGPAPVAIWLSGGGKDSPATETVSFTVGNPAALKPQLLFTLYKLAGGHLGKKSPGLALPELTATEDPLEALNYRITRRCWRDLGALLNPVLVTPAPAPPRTPAPSPRRESPAPRRASPARATPPPAAPTSPPRAAPARRIR